MLSDLRELFRFRELLYNLVSRDLKARYKHSFFGFLWSLANPLIQIATLTLVFKYVVKLNIPNYSAFFSAAFLPWTFFQTTLMDASAAVLINQGILKRVYFPREILPLTQVASNLIHFLLALLILFTYLWWCVPVHFQFRYFAYLPLIILLEVVQLAGLAMLVSCISVYFEDIRFLLTAGLNILYYASCVFYPLSYLMDTRYWWVACANPIVPLVTLYREALLQGTGLPDSWAIQPGLLLVTALWAALFFIVGYSVFNTHKWEFAERI